MKPDLTSRLRAMTWRTAPSDALQRSLQSALNALPPSLSRTQRLWRFFPAPVRWSFAACWGLSLALRLTTPAGAPPLTGGNAAASFESIQQTNDQIYALQRELQLARR